MNTVPKPRRASSFDLALALACWVLVVGTALLYWLIFNFGRCLAWCCSVLDRVNERFYKLGAFYNNEFDRWKSE